MKNKMTILLFLLTISILTPSCGSILMNREPFSSPSIDIQASDIAGTWVTNYSFWSSIGLGFDDSNKDTLIIRGDGKFKQIYVFGDYKFETPWNEWELIKNPDGRVRLYLYGARNYRIGIELAERDGFHHVCPDEYPDCDWESWEYGYYDPYADEFVEMVDKLVLNLRSDSEELVLLHLWITGTEGFPLFGGEGMVFHRIK